MKKLKKILILLNLILFGLLYVTLRDDGVKESKDVSFKDKIDKMTKFRLKFNQFDLNFEKKENEWSLKDPINWKANKLAISKFKTIFSHLNLQPIDTFEQIDNKGEKLSDFGIDENSSEIIIENTSSKTKIRLGNKSYDNTFYYAVFSESKSIYKSLFKISSDIEEILTSKVDNWINQNLIHTSLYSIDEISAIFRINDEKVNKTILSKDFDKWKFKEPFISEANNENTRLLLNNLLGIKILNPNLSVNEIEEFKNLKENWKVMLDIKTNQENNRFYFSKKIVNGNEKFRYCLSSNSDDILKIDDNDINLLSDWSSKLRNRKIFDLNSKDVKTIEILKNTNGFKINNGGEDNWVTNRISNPKESYEGDSIKINGLIEKLNALEIKEFLLFNPTISLTENSPNDNSQLTIKVTMQDTTQKTLIITKNDNDASLWKTLIKEDSILCLIDENWDEIAGKEIYDYKSRKIFQQFPKIDVVKMIENETNSSITLNEKNNIEVVSNILANFRVSEYINELSQIDGTWNKGDWVPWNTHIDIVNDESLKKIQRISISENIDDKYYLGNFDDNNLTFKITDIEFNSLIKSLNKLDE